MNNSLKPPVLATFPLGFPWPTPDPFLFCVYHRDLYPAGNVKLGPQADLSQRPLGQDFTIKDGWRMYHGQEVPGFPGHPHCGFETLTAVTEGWVDHSDSLKAAGRYGAGDVQWMTAGAGIQHAEVFPLIHSDRENPLELFQIWLNLPRASKSVAPCYKMLWQEDVPVINLRDTHASEQSAGQLTLIAGALPKDISDQAPLSPPPDSWASDPSHDVAVWLIDLEAHAHWDLPAAQPGSHRYLYFFSGEQLSLNEQSFENQGFSLAPDHSITLSTHNTPVRLLLLQGQPLNEPVVQHGPFVGNTRSDIMKAFEKYNQDQFGGWPWPNPEPVHGHSGRFARYPDGSEEHRP